MERIGNKCNMASYALMKVISDFGGVIAISRQSPVWPPVTAAA